MFTLPVSAQMPTTRLVATAGNGQVTLKWNKNSKADFPEVPNLHRDRLGGDVNQGISDDIDKRYN